MTHPQDRGKEQQLENQANSTQTDSAGSGSAQGTKWILVMTSQRAVPRAFRMSLIELRILKTAEPGTHLCTHLSIGLSNNQQVSLESSHVFHSLGALKQSFGIRKLPYREGLRSTTASVGVQ